MFMVIADTSTLPAHKAESVSSHDNLCHGSRVIPDLCEGATAKCVVDAGKFDGQYKIKGEGNLNVGDYGKFVEVDHEEVIGACSSGTWVSLAFS